MLRERKRERKRVSERAIEREREKFLFREIVFTIPFFSPNHVLPRCIFSTSVSKLKSVSYINDFHL